MRFSLLACLALGWSMVAQAEDAKPIAVKVGQEFKIALKANATTGYQWVIAKGPDTNLVKLAHCIYKRPESRLIGAGGEMVWTFQALAKGKTEIGLIYARSWEKNVKPAQTTNFIVVIRTGTDGKK
jgi:inhibitor of cysteine peptidase